jgi:hypothetical protein
MNSLDLELFDQAANELHKALKDLDKLYPNEKSLANYLESMSNLPPEQWKRFTPIKTDTERATLQNISHFAALTVSLATSLYYQYLQISGSVNELIEENDKQEKEIIRLKKHIDFLHYALDDFKQTEKDVIEILMEKIK